MNILERVYLLQCQIDLVRLQIECAELKEYDLSWLPGGKKVTRSAGRFAKKGFDAAAEAVDAAKTELSEISQAVNKEFSNLNLVKNYAGEAVLTSLERITRDLNSITSNKTEFIKDPDGKPMKNSDGDPIVQSHLLINLFQRDFIEIIKKASEEAADKAFEVHQFNSSETISKLKKDTKLEKALQSQGVDFKGYVESAQRLADESVCQGAHERINRKESLMLFLKRGNEIKSLLNTTPPKDPKLQCRILSVKSEISNGKILDKFLKGKRQNSDLDTFVDTLSAREPISGKPRTQKTEVLLIPAAGFGGLMGGSKEDAQKNIDAAPKAIETLQKILPSPLRVRIESSPPWSNPSPYERTDVVGNKTVQAVNLVPVHTIDINILLLHELGHAYENSHDLSDLTHAYIDSRAVSSLKAVSIEEMLKGKSPGLPQIKLVDAPTYPLRSGLAMMAIGTQDTDLSVPYAATKYPDALSGRANSEVISVGVETLVSTPALKSIAVQDREHLLFTLSTFDKDVAGETISTVGRKKRDR